MSSPSIAVIGAGVAGTGAARTLQAAGVEVDLYARSGETPYNRTLVNKGIATGPLEPAQAKIARHRGHDPIGDGARARPQVSARLDSGDTGAYDALVIATGSRPRALDEEVIGRDQAISAGRLTTLHSAARRGPRP